MTDTDPAPPTEGLLAKAQRVRILAENVRDAQRVAADTDNYAARLGHIQELLGQIVLLAESQRVLVEAGIPFEPSRKASSYTTSAEQFETVRQTFRDEPTSLFGKAFREAHERAQTIAGGPKAGLQGRLEKGWAAHVESTVPTPGQDQLDVFAKIPAFMEGTAELRRLYEERKRLPQSLPTSDDEVQAPRHLAAQINDAWGRLGGDAPDTVLDMLRAAGTSTGAPLSALTDAVRGWLDGHGVADSLRIRIS